jgi:hypothetical protein
MSIFGEIIAWICVVLVQLSLLLATGGVGYMFKIEMENQAKIEANPLGL